MTSILGQGSRTEEDSQPDALRKLAGHVGIMPEYVDQTGQTKHTSDDTRRAILDALGIDASSDAAALASHQRLLREAADRLMPPVRVVRQSSGSASACTVQVPWAAQSGRWRVELETEDGDCHGAEGAWAGSHTIGLTLPIQPPLGYHRLRVTVSSDERDHSDEQTLIVVPDRCVSPSELIGEGAFGLITNLYTVRSDSDWGIGDFSDLATIAAWAGTIGADFVGMNPLHALLNRGMDVSPYSPVSRLFRNPIYIDVRQVPELRDAPSVADHINAPEFLFEIDALREASAVRYEQVMAVKGLALDALHRVFLNEVRGSGSERDREYDAYVAAHEPALTRFATWMAIAE